MAFHDHFREYFREVRNKYLTNDSTELSLRTPFENFVRGLNKDFNLMQEPKRKEGIGSPDFKAFKKTIKIGYIETKDLNKNLDEELKSEQIEKYTKSIDNLILTNYSRFILLRHNKPVFDFSLFNLSDLRISGFVISNDRIEEFRRMIETFFSYNLPTIKSAEELSLELSKKGKLLKVLAKEQLEEDLSKAKNKEITSSVYDFYEGTRELIKDINLDDCADAYAQTIIYGLFLARLYSPTILDRNTAASYIPRSIGVIKRIFVNISGDSIPQSLSWIIDEVIEMLNAADMKSVLSEIDARGKTDRDPFTFFYEAFLSSYDPKKRKHLGVYYTPRPVVSFIINSINLLLKDYFNKPNGFADDEVTVLDPAVGTGTFLWLIYVLTLVELKNRGLSGLINKKIENHILKHYYGLEILITPYIIAHLKLTLVLKKWFYAFRENERIQVYLGNTLEPSESHGLMPFMKEITEESRMANRLKQAESILVVTGNPPYSVSSSNKSDWITEKMRSYKEGLDERNIQPLEDDYIKFIRFAQWKIEQNKQGIIGFVTNNSYLDGVIHRQMRKELLDKFDRIFILNLHGSSRRTEALPQNVDKDENVFDIQQGVAIAIFIKNAKITERKILYADLFGKREDKYIWLDRNNIQSIKWQELQPEPPYYFFLAKELTKNKMKKYEEFVSLKQIFKEFNIGVATGKDTKFVDFEKEDLVAKFQNRELIKEYHYRPFDIRFVYYDVEKLQRAREKIMKNLGEGNTALVCSKYLSADSFQHQFVTDKISDRCLTSLRTREGSYFFPLYILAKTNSLEGIGKTDFEKQPNFTDSFQHFLESHYANKKIDPEDVLGYIYAVLHSSAYRHEYIEFLKFDFPKIPFVANFEVFKMLSQIGSELVELHLMKEKHQTKTSFEAQGSNTVEFVNFKEGRIYINREQNFSGILDEAWNFQIGSYRVLEKWLKSRRKRELTSSEIEFFIQIVEIINKTIQFMKQIDEIPFIN
jgi:hypothetical protein